MEFLKKVSVGLILLTILFGCALFIYFFSYLKTANFSGMVKKRIPTK